MTEKLAEVIVSIEMKILPPVCETEARFISLYLVNKEKHSKRKLDHAYDEVIKLIFGKETVNKVIIGWKLVDIENAGDLMYELK